jgi:hypothetical protein
VLLLVGLQLLVALHADDLAFLCFDLDAAFLTLNRHV